MASSSIDPPIPQELLHVIIRFTNSLPDLPLSIDPSRANALSLKLLIRNHLSKDVKGNRLRLIYSGKVLDGPKSLATAIGFRPSIKRENVVTGKGKGKAKADDTTQEQKKFYIHCAVGDILTDEEIKEEATLARQAEEELVKSNSSLGSDDTPSATSGPTTSSTSNEPRGFDRLLSSGFTAAEVASLRTQFLTVLSYTHTPETMPSGPNLLSLEDRWLDSDASNTPLAAGNAATGTADDGWGQPFTSDEHGLDDIFYGVVMGFFWPLGCLVWGTREGGIWTMRRKMAVVMGVMVGLGFGFVRLSS